jgi:glycosyltransferase involved in cell wall biosynthesis
MSQTQKRLRVLISAYGCQPGKGSEFGVGWNQVQQGARFNDVWVITRSAHREVMEAESEVEANPCIHWVYFDLPGCVRLWKHTYLVRLYYYAWQLGAYFVAHRLHREVRFDVAHHVTFVSYSSPTFLALLPVPFIWGPVGGGESAPRAFRKRFNWKGRTLEVVRDVARRVGELDPFVRMVARRAALGLATTQQTEERLTKMGCKNTAVMSEAGLSEAELAKLSAIPLPDSQRPFRVFTVGRLLYWKGQELALRAFAEFHRNFSDSEYWIIGEGPDRSRLERLVHSLGLNRSVVFLGRMSRTEVFEKTRRCHALLFPSLHDSGGWVCLEAMAARRPVVCLDLGGPGLQVTPDVGIKVPAMNPEQAIADLAAALQSLATNRKKRTHLGECGRARVQRHFSWEKKGAEFADLYQAFACVEQTTGQSRELFGPELLENRYQLP